MFALHGRQSASGGTAALRRIKKLLSPLSQLHHERGMTQSLWAVSQRILGNRIKVRRGGRLVMILQAHLVDAGQLRGKWVL